VRKIAAWPDMEALSSEWNFLCRASPSLTIFSTVEWLSAWWNAFGQEKPLAAFSFADRDGSCLGIAPFYLESPTGSRLGGIKRLRLVGDGTGDSDNLDIIVRPGEETACANALLSRLASESGWDVCELNTVSADSKMAQAMLTRLQELRWPVLVSERPGSVIELPGQWEEYLASLSHEHASGAERYTRRLQRRHEVRIYRCESEEQLVPSLKILFELHQKRWQTCGQSGSFANTERRHFYLEMSRSFLRNNWLEFWLLELDGRPAAAQFAFRYGNTVYQLQEGLDPRHYSDRAGVVLRAHILKTLIAEGVRQYDFLGGIDAHKKFWGAQPRTYVDIHFARALSLGSASLYLTRCTQAAKTWLRTHLPAAVLGLLRSTA
jgi:CelD/BcsL family acetyltransferase involved in cellulose biosynthesis